MMRHNVECKIRHPLKWQRCVDVCQSFTTTPAGSESDADSILHIYIPSCATSESLQVTSR